ncbi:MAG: mandelate racemase/muconate lactonizing enzyme family protein, partial [Chthoniobacteraceae bacterium]
AAAAGWVLLCNAIGADNPAVQVEDRASSIKTTGFKTFPVGNRTLLKIETNRDVFGWGEISQLPPTVAGPLRHSMFELLDGENPTRIEHLSQKIYRAHRDFRGGAFMLHTLAGIDMALWDITAKLFGVPVYRLLGGSSRDKIRVYPTPQAYKVPAGGPKPASGNPGDIEGYVNAIKEARERVGKDGAVMLDAHSCLPPPILIQLADAIEPYDVLWIEEPAVPGNIEVFKRIKQAVKVPLATGERDRTIWDVIPYLRERCIDIIQHDCAHGGGITQMKKVAVLAETYFVPLAPHSVASFLGIAASFHVTASIPLFLIHEFYPNDCSGVLRKSWDVDKNGDSSLPQGPGLGVEVDEAALANIPPSPFKWPGAKNPDGSVADY